MINFQNLVSAISLLWKLPSGEHYPVIPTVRQEPCSPDLIPKRKWTAILENESDVVEGILA